MNALNPRIALACGVTAIFGLVAHTSESEPIIPGERTFVDAWQASDWARNAVGQILRVRSVDGNEVSFDKSLRFEYQSKFKPEIHPITVVTDVGIENLKVERLLAGDSKQRNNQFTIGFINGKLTNAPLLEEWPKMSKNMGDYEYFSFWHWDQVKFPGGHANDIGYLQERIRKYAGRNAISFTAESASNWV